MIIVTANNELNGGLVSSNMELMINSLRLWKFFSGFLAPASDNNKAIMDLLGIKDGKKIISCMIV